MPIKSSIIIKSFTWIIFSIIGLSTSLIYAQNAYYPSNGTLYDRGLHRVDLLMQQHLVDALFAQENRYTDTYYPANFVYDGIDTLYNVAVRIRGNTSRGAKKLSLKVKTNEFVNQQYYQNLKTFNFNGSHNDVSLMRESLCALVFNESDVKSIRNTWVKIYINGQYMGVYNHAEQINKEFLQSRFGNSNGNLYKCAWPADLVWIDSDQQSYKDIINPSPRNKRAYELKTNESSDDYSDLVHFIDVINNTSNSNFKNAIEQIFDVQGYLKVLAAEILIGHWDNYYYNKNNYFLYNNPATNKFEYIPYDLDNTYGLNWGVGNINHRNVHDWGSDNNYAPLAERIIAIQDYKRDLESYLYEIIQSVFNEDFLFPKIDDYREMLASSIADDPFYNGTWENNYGYTVNDWQQSATVAWGAHISFALKPYISQRKDFALEQFIFGTGLDNLHEKDIFQVYPNPASQFVSISTIENAQVVFRNISGQEVYRTQTQGSQNTIDCSFLSSGSYFLEISNDKHREIQKVVISK